MTRGQGELPPGYTVEYRKPETPFMNPWVAYRDGIQAGSASTEEDAVEMAWLHYETNPRN